MLCIKEMVKKTQAGSIPVSRNFIINSSLRKGIHSIVSQDVKGITALPSGGLKVRLVAEWLL